MAPIELYWGEQVKVRDQEAFTRGDTNGSLIVKPGETVSKLYGLPSNLFKCPIGY